MSIAVLLVDDQDLVRAGFRLIVDSEPDMKAVGEARDGREALVLVDRVKPDVVLMDIQMPNLDGLNATRQITRSEHAPRVLVLTTFERDDYIFTALRAGASGFLLKNSPPEALLEAIRTVHNGEALLAPSVTRTLIEEYVRATPQGPGPVEREALGHLTDRETDVLRALARGKSNSEIAAELYLGEGTVKTHISNLLAKIGCRDRVQAVVWAYEVGLVTRGRR